MSTREQAAIENQKKIDLALSTGEFAEFFTDRLQADIQTELSNIGLSQATIDAQQELSEMFGIPTFDMTGLISTVPETGIITETINVGTGIFTESAFRKSLDVLTNQTAIEETLFNSINNFVIKPVVDFFSQIFAPVPISELTELEKIRLGTIDKEIEELRAQLVPVPACIVKRWVSGWFNARPRYSSSTDCSARNEANIHNAEFLLTIQRLEAEREKFLNELRIVRETKIAINDLTNQISVLVNAEPFTVAIKAELSNKIEEASKTIEEIIKRSLEIEQTEISKLQLAMKAGAFALQREVSVQQTETNDILKDVGDFLFGTGAAFLEGFSIIGNLFLDTMMDLFDMTPEKLAEAQELTKAFAEAQAQEVNQ